MKKTDEARSFCIPDIDETAVNDIVVNCGLLPLTARVLVSRGITTPEAANEFLTPSLDRDWLDPEIIPGLTEVADKVEAAIRAKKRILVFGDFDVDGVSATTVSLRGLRALGADVVGLIPHRYEEGYALSEKALTRAMGYNPDLIITVDCGISCDEEVAWALEQGLDIAITDHHEDGGHVPQGVPVADPKLEEDNPSRNLAGVGVALKLLCLLGARLGQPDLWRELTDIAALGTVADLMVLKGENRALVADGIRKINEHPRMCLLALCAICNVLPEEVTSTKLSFSLIPRLNAAGRMGDASIALDLLMSDELEEAEHLATRLEAVNSQRREVESELTEKAEAALQAEFHDEPVIVVGGESWHEGVKGIVASRIARKYKRPTIIFTVEGDEARGSGRTYNDINLFDLVSSSSEDLCTKFGGHAAAIGITLPAAKLPELRDRLCSAVTALGEQARPKPRMVDAVADLAECDVAGFNELEFLQPFGNDNPVPVLAAPDVFMEKRAAVGKQGNHLRYVATDGISRVAGIYFGVDNIYELVACDSACDILFEPTVDEWQGRFTAKLMTRDIFVHAPAAESKTEISQRVDELFEHALEIADVGDYAGITQMARFNTKIVGVTFENRQAVLSSIEAGVELSLVRQPHNEFDANAIAVELLDGTQLGFLNRRLAKRLAAVMDEGVPYSAAVSAITGGPEHASGRDDVRAPGPLGVRDPGIVDRSYGVNIVVRRDDLDVAGQADASDSQLQLVQTKAAWSEVAAGELDDRLREALIGSHQLHAAQAKTLDNLARGHSTLTIMATGRGKSLIFHLHAARTALKQGKASIFMYPLRALVADQAFHLQSAFSKFGLQVCVLTGESDGEERARVFGGLADGSVDVLLTTPEFLSIHAGRFARTGRVGFVVVDEAHHVGLSRAGNRPAYAGLSKTLEELGNPLVLAVTATAGDDEARSICSTLGIERVVLDPTVRGNLHIDDRRDLRDRENYLARIAASGGKCIAYVNSREQSMKLTRMLRKRLPELACRVAFYNAGLSKADRKRIENAFRVGELQVIVSTSAFGEGIDIPDVEHVVLFHLPFNDIEFNQMSGRAGRDGRDATVHLLYSYGDARINEKILSSSAPSREQMIALYKALRAQAKEAASLGQDDFAVSNAELAEQARRLVRGTNLDESAVSCGISVFRELGFLETKGKSVARRIRMVEGPRHMELSDSVRYREGQEERDDFASFKKWALGASEDDLLKRFNRPILPRHPEDLTGA